jgi:hypothetical protein
LPSGESAGVVGFPVMFFMDFGWGFCCEKSMYHRESFATKTSLTLFVLHRLFSVSGLTVMVNWACIGNTETSNKKTPVIGLTKRYCLFDSFLHIAISGGPLIYCQGVAFVLLFAIVTF